MKRVEISYACKTFEDTFIKKNEKLILASLIVDYYEFFIVNYEDGTIMLEDNTGNFKILDHKLKRPKSEYELLTSVMKLIIRYEKKTRTKEFKNPICDGGFVNCFNEIRFNFLEPSRLYFSIEDEKLGNIIIWCNGETLKLTLTVRPSSKNFEITDKQSDSDPNLNKTIDYKITDEDLERWTSEESIYRWMRDKACEIYVGDYWLGKVIESNDLPKTLESFRKDLN